MVLLISGSTISFSKLRKMKPINTIILSSLICLLGAFVAEKACKQIKAAEQPNVKTSTIVDETIKLTEGAK